ncbi:hypothetical protein E308F_01330 [Moorella sp. E308F]|nr:hypothetical protein E308F_01330 [Moorella sp. E308F]
MEETLFQGAEGAISPGWVTGEGNSQAKVLLPDPTLESSLKAGIETAGVFRQAPGSRVWKQQPALRDTKGEGR